MTRDDELDEPSKHLLQAVRELAEIEQRKRQQPRSSEMFQRLAAEAEAKALEVWDAARDAPEPDERAEPDDETRFGPFEPGSRQTADWTS